MVRRQKRLGKVVKILNPFEVVINLGANDGIGAEDQFVVYAEGEELTDPDTGDSLGTLEIVRGQAFAKHVQERLTTLRSRESRDGLLLRLEVHPFKDVEVGDLARKL